MECNLGLTNFSAERRVRVVNSLVRFIGLAAVVLCQLPVQGGGSDTNPPADYRLTVELRDGSKVIGKSSEESFQFRSEVLGDLKLALGKIRTIESLTKSNQFRLTTSAADLLVAEFATKDIRVKATYGEVSLPVALIKGVRITTLGKTGRPHDGLVGLWSGDGNALDAVTENTGVLRNVSFTEGVAGQAFSFAPNSFPWGTYTGVQIPDRPAYALTRALTIEGWVRPRGDGYIILCRGDHRPGMDPYTLSMQANHDLRFQITGSDNAETAMVDANLPYGEWTHVAATLDGDTGKLSLYTNGVQAAQIETSVRPIGNLIPELTPGLGIGNLNDGGNNFPFVGDIDEIALYDRALSVDEINAIYSEHAANATGRAEPLPTRGRSGIRPPMGFRNAIPNFDQ